ncbi:hypothetical protein D9619_011997 [Psilocybe cf. subviscida]|uniref:Uncharacterized protein n=1 Tax=Psilocybe cf. subviscida TaxID=2480587 RepID=A0A8H5EVS3_9AGAR|nr:hypothetical protein D9619_011997 [Psilocybe cf. subviscida]
MHTRIPFDLYRQLEVLTACAVYSPGVVPHVLGSDGRVFTRRSGTKQRTGGHGHGVCGQSVDVVDEGEERGPEGVTESDADGDIGLVTAPDGSFVRACGGGADGDGEGGGVLAPPVNGPRTADKMKPGQARCRRFSDNSCLGIRIDSNGRVRVGRYQRTMAPAERSEGGSVTGVDADAGIRAILRISGVSGAEKG